jgi:hypothetical protein
MKPWITGRGGNFRIGHHKYHLEVLWPRSKHNHIGALPLHLKHSYLRSKFIKVTNSIRTSTVLLISTTHHRYMEPDQIMLFNKCQHTIRSPKHPSNLLGHICHPSNIPSRIFNMDSLRIPFLLLIL